MVPVTARAEYVDVTAAIDGRSVGRDITFTVLTDAMHDPEEEPR
jgi:hypothetical protein